MKVKLTRDWGKHKKGDSLDIKDKTVLAKGNEVGLFEGGKKPADKSGDDSGKDDSGKGDDSKQ